MAEAKDGCLTPAKGPILKPEGQPSTPSHAYREEPKMIAQVGKPAPDFEASAFLEGGFKNISSRSS